MITLNTDELTTLGVQSYREREFAKAIEYFREILNRETTNWQIRLYLGMAYVQAARTKEAGEEFKTIIEFCPEIDIRNMALTAQKSLVGQSQQKLSPISK